MSFLKSLAISMGLCSLMCLAGCAGLSNGSNTQQSTQTNTTSDFGVAVTPASASVAKGSTATLTANVTAQGGFTGSVQLALYGLPSGVTAAFSSNTVAGSGTPTITVAASTGAASGTYTLTLSGTSGMVTHNTSFSLAVTGTGITPDFSITTNPNQQAIGVGGTETFSVTVIALNDYTETVNLSASGLPAGMSASFSPAAITGSGISTLTIAAASTAVAGTSTLTISGAGTSVSHSVTVGVTVTTTAPPPDFTLTVAPTSQTIAAADSTSVTVSIAPANGFTGAVALAVSGAPAGMTASCTPASITTLGSCTLNISTTSAIAAGTYILTVTGTSGSLTHSGAVSITVTPVVLTPDFSLNATPSSQSVVAGTSTTFTASVGALNSFTGVVTMSATGLPTGVTVSFAPATVTGSGSSTATLASTSATAAGTYFVTLTGTSGSLVHSMNVSLTVTPGSTGVSLNVLTSPGASGNSLYNDVPTYLYNNPTVAGATIAVEWGAMDQGPSAGSSQYDWTYPDAQMAPWVAANKKVNFVVWANADLGATTCAPNAPYGLDGSGNCGIPAYVWTALGSANQTTCVTQYGTQIMPNYFATAFQSNYQTFMAAMIQHYTGNASVGYIRFGLGHGGESLPVSTWNDTTSACGQAYVNTWGLTIPTWENYLSTMINYEGSLSSPIQLMVGVTPMGSPNTAVPDFAAPIAVQNHIGFGSQGLEESDVNNCPGATADWCVLFTRYSSQVPTELQTLLQSCPLGGCTTGSLSDLIPFAVANHTSIFEIYWQDWLVAYDPNSPGYYPGYQPVFAAASGK